MKRVALLLPLVFACASHVQEDEPANTPNDDPAEDRDRVTHVTERVGPVVATMVTREYRLGVRNADGATVFTVSDDAGRVMAENIDLWQLARDYPVLHRQYETAFAGEGIGLDARVDRLDPECEHCGRGPLPR